MGKKAQSGRAKQKQKAQAQKKSPGKVPFAKQLAKGQLFDDDESSGPMFRGFAQRSGQSTPQYSTMKLRHQAIAFVSAGSSTPAEKEKDAQMLDDEAIAAALAEQADDQDDDFEDDEDDDDDIDDSAIQTNIVDDTDADIAQETGAMHIQDPVESSMNRGLDGAVDIDMAPAHAPAHTDKPPTPPQNGEPSFVIDTVGDPALAANFKSKIKAPVRAASPTPSDSSGDEIVFRGRKATVIDDPYSKPKPAPQQPQSRPRASKSPTKPAFLPPHKKHEAHVTDDLLAALGVSTESSPVRAPPSTGWSGKPSKFDKQLEEPSEGFTPAPEGSWWRKKGMPRLDLGPSTTEKKALDQEAAATPRKTKVGFAEPEEELGAEETIASLQADWKDVKNEKKRAARAQRELDEGLEAAEQPKAVNRAVAHQLGVKTSRRGKRGRKRQNQLLRDLNSDDSDEELAMARDYMENLRAQGEDISGLQSADGGPSLVIDGKVIGEDELLDDSMRDIDPENIQFGSGSSDSDSDIIGQDLDELDDDDEDLNASDYDSSDLDIDLEYDEREQWEDEEDLRRRRIEAMDDEMIARLFHKQAELGIDSEELVIDDGAFVDEEIGGFGDLDDARAGLEDLTNISFGRSSTRPARRGGKKGGFSFPDASALADAVDQYGESGFDIMDYDRPSLRPTKKGRKGKMPPELEALEDEDLRDTLRGAWDNDRAKKSFKKQEREELRRQGLLGNNGRADLSQKYLQGMTMVQVHDELRIFMQDDDQEVKSFPPMLKEDRAALHAIASRLNLTSKSQGQGKKRFPMLYKTTRTPDYNEAQFRRVLAASERGFLKNASYKSKGARGGAAAGRGGRGVPRGGRGGAAGGHGLRDGEEVGANAKEIGTENFGHRLMEKMGWTKGTALGKDGSGLLVPVAQVMKTGRGGLG